ncbi:uncharacterized protein YueI [Anaerosolibacter carboniphilus]|uniref:Uncharacterized protein YueI n=1 Tax=Anaerosolibacter carboniphilus TaxID=1417629 RepID=A0A841KSI4_9FIRM|nr:YueI family protein [Anaerosolibacter carboniphilus]MBB6216351.1 uncharacterized protein YueI [Anaerosolibacter carboniphilus]
MDEKNQLERYIDFALYGTPEIKADEKRNWLGEFRERVVLALTDEQIQRDDALQLVEEKMKDRRIDALIVKGQVNQEIAGKLMTICQRTGKDYRSVNRPDSKGDVAMVLVSDEAVNEEEVILDTSTLLSDQFYNARNNKLCKKHMEELRAQYPQFENRFEEISVVDKMIGTKCGVCEDERDLGPLY